MIEVVRAYAAALAAHDWPALARVLHPDVVYEVPQTRERVRGREAYVRFNREFPGDWTLRVVDASADGLVTSVTDYRPAPYEPPPGREHLVERY